VFFQIDNSVKKTCLDKCEKFSKKIQSEDISEGEINLDEAEMLADDNHLYKLHKNNNNNSTEKKNKRKNNTSRENNIVKFKIFLSLFLMVVKFGLIYFFFFSHINTLGNYIKVFNITSQEQNYYLFLYNLQRDYFSNPSSMVWNYPSHFLFNKSLESIYDFKENLRNVYYLLPIVNRRI
jgi:ATP-dependent Zn protease